MIWQVFRVYFFLYLIPCAVMMVELCGQYFGISMENVPPQYSWISTGLYAAGCFYAFICTGNELFSRTEHVQYFGDRCKYSFVWTWILFVPAVISFHQGLFGQAFIQGVVFVVLECLRRRHNNYWEYDERQRVIQKAKDAKAPSVEIDQ